MTDNPFLQFSQALAAQAVSAKESVASLGLPGRHLTATLWRPDILVASEQSLPKGEEFEAKLPGGATQTAKLAGRDPGTNIAALRLASPVTAPSLTPAEPQLGAAVLAIGSDGQGGASARLGLTNLAGPEWHSSHGGRIERRILLDVRLGRTEEGGPVFDAAGGCLGISTFGPHGQVLAIPLATVERIAPLLLKEGRVARGWLGVALQPVAIPDALREAAEQSSGLMVMSLAERGPAAAAGIVAGDIILSVDGVSTRRFRSISSNLGAEQIGKKTALRVVRGGSVISVEATIAERPPA